MESVGILPVAVGVAFNLAADAAFHKAGTTVKPFEESSALVTDGVYRIHPQPYVSRVCAHPDRAGGPSRIADAVPGDHHLCSPGQPDVHHGRRADAG